MLSFFIGASLLENPSVTTILFGLLLFFVGRDEAVTYRSYNLVQLLRVDDILVILEMLEDPQLFRSSASFD